MALPTLKQINAARRERLKLPRTVQEVTPVRAVYEDGVFQVGERLWSKTYQFSDINYLVAAQEEREAMFRRYENVLGCLGAGATYQITVNDRRLNMRAWEDATLMPLEGDGLDSYRTEYNGILRREIQESDGIQQEKYITVTVAKPDAASARAYFTRISTTLQSNFASLGSRIWGLELSDRLRLLHDFFHPGEEERFRFDFQSALRLGADFRDAFSPASITRHSGYLRLGGRYARALFAIDYASYVQDDLVSRLTDICPNVLISFHVVAIPTDEAEKEVQRYQDGVEAGISRWQQSQNRNNNFSAIIPYDRARQREELAAFMDELTTQDQTMNLVTMTLVHTADTLEQLDADTQSLMQIRDVRLIPATFQQLSALQTTLPFGVNRLSVSRTLLSRCLAAVSMPFRVQEIQEEHGVWLGKNALSRNMILCNRANLQNQGMFILGVPGSGKSMIAKIIMVLVYLSTQDHILINDPEGEYAELVRALGGTVVDLYAGGDAHINAMDIEAGYGDGLSDAVDKAQYILTLMEQMAGGDLTAQEQSVLDRCVLDLYALAKRESRTVTLRDLREDLLKQAEEEAQRLALILERFTTGSLDIFAHETNVDLHNRLICFTLRKMQKQLRPTGQLAITDFLINRVNANAAQGVRTHIYTDETQTFYQNPTSAAFFDTAWRIFRKRGAYPTAITQNIAVVLADPKTSTQLSNSEIIIMLNQSAPDRERLRQVFQIPEEQMNYVRDAEEGCGLLRYGKSVIPFVNRFPKNTKLYSLFTTKPEEGFRVDV